MVDGHFPALLFLTFRPFVLSNYLPALSEVVETRPKGQADL